MIAVIADDFTGAAEIGGVGLKFGYKVVIETRVKEAEKADLLIIAADTRSLPATDASWEIEKITKELQDLAPECIFKKLDSVLRGNIASELNAQLKVLGKKRAILVAGNPAFGRLIKNGKYTVDSVPLAETSFANDPDFPIRSSEVTEIVGKSQIPVFSLSIDDPLPENGIIIGDVNDHDELVKWTEKKDENTIVAGGAGFFDVLIGKRKNNIIIDSGKGKLDLGDKTLFVFGSMFPKSREALEGLNGCKKCLMKINMPDEIYENKNFDPAIMDEWAGLIAQNIINKKQVIVTVEQTHSNEKNLSARISRNIAELVRKVTELTELTDLLIEGGTTTSEILKSLGITTLYPYKFVDPGIIQMKVEKFPGLTITTKPGSYLWPESVKH